MPGRMFLNSFQISSASSLTIRTFVIMSAVLTSVMEMLSLPSTSSKPSVRILNLSILDYIDMLSVFSASIFSLYCFVKVSNLESSSSLVMSSSCKPSTWSKQWTSLITQLSLTNFSSAFGKSSSIFFALTICNQDSSLCICPYVLIKSLQQLNRSWSMISLQSLALMVSAWHCFFVSMQCLFHATSIFSACECLF